MSGSPTHDQRFEIITFLRDAGFTHKEVDQMLKQFLSAVKYRHCVIEERQLYRLFFDQRELSKVFSCQSIRSKGRCLSPTVICPSANIYLEVQTC